MPTVFVVQIAVKSCSDCRSNMRQMVVKWISSRLNVSGTFQEIKA